MVDGVVIYQWFNGTHVTKVVTRKSNQLGLQIQAADADSNGNLVGEFEVYSPQENYWKDVAAVLAEGLRYCADTNDALYAAHIAGDAK